MFISNCSRADVKSKRRWRHWTLKLYLLQEQNLLSTSLHFAFCSVFLSTCVRHWWRFRRHTFKGFVQLDPVFPDEVAIVFAEPQFGVLCQIIRVLLCLIILCLIGRFCTIGHTIALVNKEICQRMEMYSMHTETGRFNTFFLPLRLHLAPTWLHLQPSLPNPDQLTGNDCRPTCRRPGQAPRQRKLSGQWPPSFHGEPTGRPQTTRGRGVALPDGQAGRFKLSVSPVCECTVHIQVALTRGWPWCSGAYS